MGEIIMNCTKTFFLSLLVLMVSVITSVQASESDPQHQAYPNSNLLVSTKWLTENLENKNIVVLDIRENPDEFIPGSYPLNGVIVSTDVLKSKLEALGLRKDHKIIICDTELKIPGNSQFLFWALEYLGFEDIHVLSGGWNKWAREKRPTVKSPEAPLGGTLEVKVNDSCRATSDQIKKSLKDPKTLILDVRSEAEYNGWPLTGQKRGGHIPGALNISLKNLLGSKNEMPEPEPLAKLLEERRVSPDNKIIVCSEDPISGASAYFLLRLSGYPHCAFYEGSMSQWASNANLPMERLPRYEKLVYAKWLKDLMDGKNPPTYSGKKYVILETRYVGKSISQPGQVQEFPHIPGAIAIHPCYLEHENNTEKYYPKYSNPSDGNLLPPNRLKDALRKLGITKDTLVVVYGNGKITPMTSARVAWALMYAGVEDVRILNGGFTAWREEGFPIADKPAKPVEVSDFNGTVPGHPEYLATTDYIKDMTQGKRPESVLVEVRRLEEHDGKINPYGFFEKKGRIPESAWMGDWNALVNLSNDTFRSQSEILNIWKKLNVTPEKEPVFYCGTGWRSSMGFFFAYLAGFDKMRNYDGSFYEWSWDDNRPIIATAAK